MVGFQAYMQLTSIPLSKRFLAQNLLNQYAQLDDYGRHTINAVMKVEYDRCTELSAPSTDSYGVPSVNVSADELR